MKYIFLLFILFMYPEPPQRQICEYGEMCPGGSIRIPKKKKVKKPPILPIEIIDQWLPKK